MKIDFRIVADNIEKTIKDIIKTTEKTIRDIFEKICRLFRFSITFKMSFLFAARTFGDMLLLGIMLWVGFVTFLGYDTFVELREDSQYVKALISNNNIQEEELKKLGDNLELNIVIEDGEGKEIFSVMSGEVNYSENNLFNIHDEVSISYVNSKVFRMEHLESAAYEDRGYKIKISKELYEEQKIAIIAIIIWIAVMIITTLENLFFTKKTTKKMIEPVHEITNIIKDINVNNLNTRINVKGSHDELKDLAITANNMFDRLQESYEKQNQFVSDASHELRTPIAVIQGYANMLSRWGKEDKEVLDESISAIKNESESMSTLVENLLFLARADKSTQKNQKEMFDLSDLMKEISKETKVIDHTHEIVESFEGNIEFFGDRSLIKQCIRIFIDNSIKFTPEGGKIILELYEKNNSVCISIEDTGEGIPEEDIPKIFHRFYRVDKSRTKDTGGTGLGLSIAKWIVDSHDGLIEVKSKIGEGTKLLVYFSR